MEVLVAKSFLTSASDLRELFVFRFVLFSSMAHGFQCSVCNPLGLDLYLCNGMTCAQRTDWIIGSRFCRHGKQMWRPEAGWRRW